MRRVELMELGSRVVAARVMAARMVARMVATRVVAARMVAARMVPTMELARVEQLRLSGRAFESGARSSRACVRVGQWRRAFESRVRV